MPIYNIYGASYTPGGGGCSFPAGNFDDGNPICDWGYRVGITIQASQVTADLTDFQIEIDLNDLSATFWANVKSDGGDIRATKDDGSTEIPLTVHEGFNTGTSFGWVTVKFSGTLSSSTNTTIYLYYGNPAASAYAVTATYGRNAVYSQFSIVHDMAQDPSGSAPQVTDLTGNGCSATTAGGMTSADMIAGKLIAGYDMDSTDYFEPSCAGTTGGAARMFSIWFLQTARASGAGEFIIFVQGDRAASVTGGRLHLALSRTTSSASPNNGGIFFRITGGGYTISSNLDDGNWHHLVVRVPASAIFTDLDFILDGTLYNATGSTTAVATTTGGIDIGGPNNFSYERCWDGDLSYFMHAPSDLGLDWAYTTYNNQSSPGTFYTVGSDETA